jgi:hypothetical protein
VVCHVVGTSPFARPNHNWLFVCLGYLVVVVRNVDIILLIKHSLVI